MHFKNVMRQQSAVVDIVFVSYLPWFEVFFKLLNYIFDILKCCTDESELSDVMSLLERLMSTDVSRPLQHVEVPLPSSGLVSSI